MKRIGCRKEWELHDTFILVNEAIVEVGETYGNYKVTNPRNHSCQIQNTVVEPRGFHCEFGCKCENVLDGSGKFDVKPSPSPGILQKVPASSTRTHIATNARIGHAEGSEPNL